MKLSPELTDDSLLLELGARLAQRRLQRGWSQAELASRAGVSKRSIERLESGTSIAFVTVLRVFRALELMDSLDAVLPAPQPSPMALLELRRDTRKRAPRARKRERPTTPWNWSA